MAEKYELDRWAAVVCNGFTAVNVMSSGNVEELGWDYTEMELDPTGTCGLFDGMLLAGTTTRPPGRDHEAYFPDAFTVGARILADDWDHELGNDEVRSRCFAIIEDADQFTDHDTARDWLCESTMADFSEVEARTFFQNLTLMDSEEIAKLDGRPIIPSAGADECRAAVLAFNERMVPRRRELGLGDTAVVGKTKKSETTSKVVPMKKEQAVHGLGRVDFSGLGYGWGERAIPTRFPSTPSASISRRGAYIILNFSPSRMPPMWTAEAFFHETTIVQTSTPIPGPAPPSDRTSGPRRQGEAREFAEKIGSTAAARVRQARIEAPGLTGREARSQGRECRTQPSAQAEAARPQRPRCVRETGGGKHLWVYFTGQPFPFGKGCFRAGVLWVASSLILTGFRFGADDLWTMRSSTSTRGSGFGSIACSPMTTSSRTISSMRSTAAPRSQTSSSASPIGAPFPISSATRSSVPARSSPRSPTCAMSTWIPRSASGNMRAARISTI
ncbi:MAG: hypothetical protein ACLTZW_07665 [Paratractidigestivibacter faecalis]